MSAGAIVCLVAVFMPEMRGPGEDMPSPAIPDAALREVADVPAVVSLRFNPSQSFCQDVSRRLRSNLLLNIARCPFSAAAGAEAVDFDDNGWFFAVSGDSR